MKAICCTVTVLSSVMISGCWMLAPSIDSMPSAVVEDTDWPWLMGPGFDNIAEAGQTLPVNWSESDNVVWQTEIPGRGHATPCVVGKRVFLPSGDKEKETIWLFCLDRDTGKTIWQTTIYKGPLAKIHENNSYASATPASDGKTIFFPYQTAETVRIAALNPDGTIRWDKLLSPYVSIQGFSASPVLYKAVVITAVDGTHHTKVTALHRESGDLIWEANIAAEHESYGTGLIGRVAGRDQLILVGPDDIRSFDPDTGEPLWGFDGPAMCYVAVAAFGEDTVYATGGYPKRALLAIKADGSGDVTETHLAWKSDGRAGYVPSMVLNDGLLYAISDDGIARCYDALSGDIVWEKRMQTKFYSSPVLVGDRLYVFDRKGKGFVLKAGRAYEVIAENELPDGAFATPAICGGRIYLRTLKKIYCLGE